MASGSGFSESQLHELKTMITKAVEEAFAKYPGFAIATPSLPTTAPPPAVVALPTPPPPPPAASPIAVAPPTPPPPAPPAPPAAVKSSPSPRSPTSNATSNTKRRCTLKAPPAALAIATPPPAAWPLACLLAAAWQLVFSSLLAGVLTRRPPPQGIG